MKKKRLRLPSSRIFRSLRRAISEFKDGLRASLYSSKESLCPVNVKPQCMRSIGANERTYPTYCVIRIDKVLCWVYHPRRLGWRRKRADGEAGKPPQARICAPFRSRSPAAVFESQSRRRDVCAELFLRTYQFVASRPPRARERHKAEDEHRYRAEPTG